jgi:outer membrane lipoprotein-sorting protein
MSTRHSLAGVAALALPFLLTGCSIFPTTRHLPVPKPPLITQTATPEELIARLNQHWDAVNTLTATVEIYATQTKTAEGIEKDFPSCRGYIVMHKPKQLRVVGTYFGVKIFDMASDGEHFTLVMPTKNMAIQGPNAVTEKSTNSLENLRPDFFLNAIIVPGLDPDDEYMVAGDTETVEDTAKKNLYIEPEYILSIMRRKTGHEILPVRVVTFHRDDMLPYGQDTYDANGNVDTEITYSNYTEYNTAKYPSKVTIKRPQEGIQIVLSVIRVEENVNLPASQFEVSIPDGAKIKTLH